MEDNKLVFPVGFDLTKGTEEVKKKFEELQKQAQKMSESITKASGKGVKSKELTGELAKIKSSMTAVTHAVKQFADVQVKSEQASSKVAIAQNKAAKSAQQLEAATARAEMAKLRLANAQNKINTGFKTQSRLLSQVTMQIGAYTSIYALLRFATAVRDITAQFELQRVALTAILQDKAAADKIFGQILVQALESPFRIKDIISYTKQLAAYRVETENLFETTKRLADISAGLGVDMSRLVLAYGQVRAASVLRGQELRQFTEAGIPLVKLLAEKFTELRGTMVSTGEVFELISRRAVPFRMIEEIFNDMTNAGGIFYNMQKIQAETLHGVWMNLKDAYDKMYYEIGQKNMGVLKGMGMFLRNMADNWETVYHTLMSVVAGFTSYNIVVKISTARTMELTIAQLREIALSKQQVAARLASIKWTGLANAATKLYAISQGKLAVANGLLAKSFWKLTAAMAANPIAAIIGVSVAAIIGLGYAISKLMKYQTEYEKSVDKLNKKKSELSSSSNDEILRLNILYKRLEQAKEGTEEYAKVRGEISSKYGLYLKDLKDEAGNVLDLKDAYEQLSSKILDAARARSKTELLTLVSEETVNAQKKIFDEIDKLLKDKYGEIQGAEYARRIKISLTTGDSFDEEIKDVINSFNKVSTIVNQEPSLVEMLIMGKDTRGAASRAENILDSWMNTFKKTTSDYKKLVDDVESDFPDVDVIPKVTEESLVGLKKYVSELESLQKRSTGVPIKLYDSIEDISKFGSGLDLLEDIAKKYKEAGESVEYLSKQINNLKITQKERDTYKSDLDIARAEQELARLALARYNALYLVEDNRGTKGTTPQDILRDEINMVKDARDAYEAYLKTMTEVRAKQTVESQLKFAGLDFDISDAGAYREYLQNVYDRIKSDPNYAAVRTLIEDMLVKFDIDLVERELNAKLSRIANNIAKTQRANDFFEKILGITGDIELSKMLTIKYTGVEAGDIGYQMKEQLQSALREALGDEGLDLSGMGIEQIRSIVETIPEGLSTAGDKSKKFFQDFEKYMQDAQTSALELDEKLRKLGLDDASLFGTGVTLDVQKITRDLSNSNKELARERSQLEAEILADKRAKDKKWLNEQLVNIDKIFRTRQENEKTLSQDKLNDLAKAYVEERLFQEGISELLQDVGDKTYTQLERARRMLKSISETQLLSLSDETMKRINEFGYTIDELMSIDTVDGVFESLGDNISNADVEMLKLLWHMNQLGLSTEDVENKIKEILSGKTDNASVEALKKLSGEISTVTGSLFDLFEGMGMDSGVVRAIEDLVSNLKVLIVDSGVLRDVFDKVGESAKDFGEEAGDALNNVSDTASQTGTSVGGIIGAFIGAYVAIVNIIQAVQDAKEAALADEADRYLERTNKQLELLKKRLDDLSSAGDISWFDDDILKSVQNLYGALESAQSTFISSLKKALIIYKQYHDRYLELMAKSDLKKKEKAELTDLLIYEDTFGYIQRLYNELDKIGISVGDGFNILDIDEIKNQLKELEKIQAILEASGDEYAKELAIVNLLKGELEYIVEYYDELKGVIESFVGDISGSLLTTVNDIWKEIRDNGIKTFDDVKEAAKGDIAEILDAMVSQFLWSKYMGDIFNDFGVALTDAIALDGSEGAIMDVFDDFWDAMGSGLKGYTEAYNMFLDSAEKRGWGMSVDAEQFAPGSLNELNEQLNDLQEQWNALSQAEREAAAGLELWNKIEAKQKEIDEAQSYYDYVSALDEAVSKYDDLIDKSKYLKSIVESLAEGGEKDYAQSLLDQTNAEIWAGLYAEYLPDMVKFNDELKDMQKQIEWAIENGYPELAEWIQKAYDTKILDKWKEGIDEIANGLDDDFDKYKYYQDEIKKAAGMLVMAILGGDETGSADWAARLKYLEELLAELEGSMEDRMWDKYATDAQKYEQELSDINKDLQWALDNYPELADEIADAFNTRVLEEWQDKWDETFGDIDLNLERLNAIEAELAAIGVPEISEEEARAGRDAALLSGDTDAYNYYQEQLLMHQKINFLLRERAEIIDELGNKYKTDEETYQDEIAQYESDIAAMRALLKEAREDGDAEAASRWEKEIADAGAAMEEFINNADFDALQEEFERQFGDISDIGTAEVKKMLDAFRQQVEDSELPPEMKEKILDDIDDIYDDLDKRTQESFNKIGTAIKDIGSLLENFGAEQGLVDSISAIGDAVSVLGDITYAIAKNDWWSVFSLAVKFVNSLVKATQNLVQLVDVDSISGLAEAYDKLTYAISRSVGMDRKRNQDAARQNLVDQRNEIARELQKEKSKWGFSFDWFGKKVQILGPDQGVVNALTQQLNQIDGALTDLGDTMKEEFLQTDYTSFSESLAEILIAPWDSYAEMMDAVNELTEQTINNIVKHALSLHLQAQIKDALDALYDRGISEDSFEIFRGDLAKIVKDGQLVAKYYGQFYDDMASSSEAYNTISRITESQANSFLGYYQNYLIIMTDMHNIMKRIWDNMNHGTININLDAHLSALQTIVANTGAIANNTSRIGQLADDMRSVKNSLAKSGAY